MAKSTKEQLIKLGKSLYKLALKASDAKEEIIAQIIQATKKSAPAKAPTKKEAAKKPAIAKKVAPKAAPKAKEAKKETPKKKVVAAAPVMEKPEKKKAVPPTLAAPVRQEAPKTAQTKPPRKKGTTGAATTHQAQNKVGVTVNKIPMMSARDEDTAEESKYYVATAQEHLESAQLPWSYQDDRIFLLVRDPFWSHAAWDLNPNTPQATAWRHGLNLSEFHIALRMYDVTDIEFNGTNAHKFFDIDVNMLKGSWYLNVPEDDRNYCVEVGLKNGRGDFYMMARSNVILVPRNGVSSRLDEEWMVADEDFWKMYALSGGFQVGKSATSMELSEMMRQRLAGETSSGAVSSFGGSIRPKKQQDKFWFRLDCELIVYGATEPDATVTMMGRKVELRPDGTFTARFSLPDGMQVIETTAVSASRKYEKTITPTVSRSTTVFQNRELSDETGETEA